MDPVEIHINELQPVFKIFDSSSDLISGVDHFHENGLLLAYFPVDLLLPLQRRQML
jgi:hypothetical protein